MTVLLTGSLFAGSLANIKVDGSSIIIGESGHEYVIPRFNIVSLDKTISSKTYEMNWYGYYRDGGKSSYISKSDYEMLKRLLSKAE